jgi:Protein of unknown function (DUF4013)
MQSLNYFAPFTYFFKSKDWLRKFIIASLLTYTLIGAAPILGWMIVIVQRVGRAEELQVPELADWKTFWKLGGQFAGVNTIWLLPMLVAAILLYLPAIFVHAIPPGMMLTVFGAVLSAVLVILLVYSLVYAFFFPAMQVLLARGDSAWQSADPRRLWQTIRAHFIPYLVVFLIVGLALFNIILLVAAVTAFLLLPPLLVYAGLVSAHYAGQLARLDRDSFGLKRY